VDLKRKLARLSDAGPGSRGFGRPTPGASPGAARRERVERLRHLMSDLVARRQKKLRDRSPNGAVEVRLPGELRDTEHGPVHVVESWLEPSHCHGRVPIADALGVDPKMVARLALDETLEGIDPRKVLLLDTETTGLSGGTGTIAFLIGLAWFEDESLRIQQLFLRRPGEEAPMLRLLADRLERSSCLVTYNGKAFDWPLIRARYVLNRVPMPEPKPHLDLLHCARRVYKRRLERVRLVHMEAQVLGMHREYDIDGAEIPSIYLDFIRGADGSALAPVIEHNANDLVALAAIMAEVATRFATLHEDDDPRDHLGFARVAERADDEDRALSFARAAADGGGDESVTVDALVLAARLCRRRKDVGGEEQALLAAVGPAASTSDEALATVHLLLSKHYEHRQKDAARALEHARLTAAAELEEAHARRVSRLEARVDRLEARLGRQRARRK
jgi:uncharacterized protein YprB with RNaseH-like and TPR domain